MQVLKKYSAAPGAQFTTSQARVYGPELERLGASKNGSLTPDEVVQAAASRRSALHSYFEWDDEKCGINFRRSQARHLLSHIRVTVRLRSGKLAPHKAYFNVETHPEEKPCYVTVERVINEPRLQRQVVDTALREARDWADRYKAYTELRKIRVVIYKTMKAYRQAIQPVRV